MSYRIEPLAAHDRAGFASGSDALDGYFLRQATQDIRRRIASCFVALDDADALAGYYTLAATAVALNALPPTRAKKLPRYPLVPAALLGRLAVALSHQGEGLGALLVADAMLRAKRADVAAYAIVVDAKDEKATRFYEHLGFERLGSPRRLFHALGGIDA